MQHTVLTTGYHLLCRADAARGISAMPPADYAERFEAFAGTIGASLAVGQAAVDEVGAHMMRMNAVLAGLVWLILLFLVPIVYVSAQIVTVYVIIEKAIRFTGLLAAMLGMLLVYAGAAGVFYFRTHLMLLRRAAKRPKIPSVDDVAQPIRVPVCCERVAAGRGAGGVVKCSQGRVCHVRCDGAARRRR